MPTRFIRLLAFLFLMIFFSSLSFALVSPVSDISVVNNNGFVSVDVSDTIIYSSGYYRIDGDIWQPFSLDGTSSIGSWQIGSASNVIDLSSSSGSSVDILIYGCSWNNGWDCHGNDWQIKAVSLNSSTAGKDLTFSEIINPTGDPIGGGPGYSNIITQDKADHVILQSDSDPRSKLLNLMLSYYDESLGSQVRPSSPAQSGETVWIHPSLEIDLTGYYDIVIPDGVTIASDRGYRYPDGSYSWGALLHNDVLYWKKSQVALTPFLRNDGPGVRITGLRIRGPSGWAGMTNANSANSWQGASLAIKQPKTETIGPEIAEGLEIDNNEIYGWDNWAIWYEQSDNGYAHHNWIHNNRREGYGYGLWPGEPSKDYMESDLLVEGNMFSFHRHSIDGRGNTPDAHERPIFYLRHNVFADHHMQTVVNAHESRFSGGTEVSGWKRIMWRNLWVNTGGGMGQGAPPPGGLLNFTENYLARENECSIASIRGGHPICIFDPDHQNYDPDYKDRFNDPIGDIYARNNHAGKEGQVLPRAFVSVDKNVVYENDYVTFTFNSLDPDGHPIRYHEIIFGTGKDRIDSAGRIITTDNSVKHTFPGPGGYDVRVRAFNSYGIPSESYVYNLTVLPEHDDPILSVWLASDWAPTVTTHDDWTGYYNVSLRLNGVPVWSKDMGLMSGWENVLVNVSDILAKGSIFQPTFKIEVLQDIARPDSAEPGEANIYIDDLHLLNFPQSHVKGAYYSTADPGLNTKLAMFNDWGISGNTKARDSRTGYGSFALLNIYSDSKGSSSEMSPSFNILGFPEISASEDENSIFLSWSKVKVAAGYEIRYGTESGKYNKLVDVNGTLNYLIENLQENTDYYIQVRSYGLHRIDNSIVYSEWSDEIKVTTQTMPEYLSSLQAAWMLDEASAPYNDSINGDEHAFTKGTAGSRTGLIGNEAVFDGTSSLSVGRLPSRLVIGKNDYSVEMWVTPQGLTSSYAGLFSDGGGGSGGDQGLMIAVRDKGNVYVFLGTEQSRPNMAGGSILDGQRHHVAVSLDRDGLMYLWVDGNLVKTSDISAFVEENLRPSGPIEIAPKFVGRYIGAIDEVRVWNNRVLNQTNIDYLYNNGTGRSYTELASD